MHDTLGVVFRLPDEEELRALELALAAAASPPQSLEPAVRALMDTMLLDPRPVGANDDTVDSPDQRYAVWGARIVFAAIPTAQQLLPAADVTLLVLEAWRTHLLRRGTMAPEWWFPDLTAATIAALVGRHAHLTYGVPMHSDVMYSVRTRVSSSCSEPGNRCDYEVRVAVRIRPHVHLLYDCDARGQVIFHLDTHGRRAQWSDRPNLFMRTAEST
jgi:hypothetical protein